MKVNEQNKFFGKEAGEDWALFIHNRKSPFPVIIENIGITHPNPRYRISRTNNDMFIFEYILSGSGYLEVNGHTYNVSANDVYIIEPGQDHVYYSNPKNPFKKIWINFYSDLFYEIFKSFKLPGKIVFKNTNTLELFEKIQSIKKVSNFSDDLCYDIAPILFEILCNLARNHNTLVNVSKTAKLVKNYIDENIYFNIKIEDAAEKLNLSKAHIIREFTKNYGISPYNYLIEQKKLDKELIDGEMTPDKIRNREEIAEQIKALDRLKIMAASYGCDISRPAETAQEAIQAVYFGYLGAIKDQNGAAMSIGRISTFLDIYIERDLKEGKITEIEAQELIDHLVMKLRIVKFMRIQSYNELFSGDPTWVTEAIGGMGVDGRTLVTRTSFRVLHTLRNLGPAPEPNLTVLWSKNLPLNFKRFCAQLSIDTSSVQYESDDLMRPEMGDDYAIACCVSAMRVGKDMQFFGARANLAKCLLYALNGGADEMMLDKETGKPYQVSPVYERVTSDEPLDYKDVMKKFDQMTEWLAGVYVNVLNIIHYMHDKYAYEAIEMALHDSEVRRFFATGIAGLSCAADSLSAIKYAKVYPIRNEHGIIVDFRTEGDFPKYGNNDDRADEIAVNIVKSFMNKIKKHFSYRESVKTMSILTITSNVVYGKNTGNTPDGRRAGEALAPGANPMHGRDSNGALASLESVAKLPYSYSRDGISNTFSITPASLGKDD